MKQKYTILYVDSTTDKMMTYEEVKATYMENNDFDLPISDDEMDLIIMENLVQNGGNIILIQDEILSWCNEYAKFKEADRYLNQIERDESIKNIYQSIVYKDKELLDTIKHDLSNYNEVLYGKLNNILKDIV